MIMKNITSPTVKNKKKPHMDDIYKYLINGEGKIIGKKAREGDKLCKKIINRYIIHYYAQACLIAARELRGLIKEYTLIIRMQHNKWPIDIPFALRDYETSGKIILHSETKRNV